jgi:flagellar motor protein MotB
VTVHYLPSARPRSRQLLAVASPAAEDDQTGWLVTFADLVLQLFAFVIVAVVIGNPRQIPAERSGAEPAAARPPASSVAPVASTEASRLERSDERGEPVAAAGAERVVEDGTVKSAGTIAFAAVTSANGGAGVALDGAAAKVAVAAGAGAADGARTAAPVEVAPAAAADVATPATHAAEAVRGAPMADVAASAEAGQATSSATAPQAPANDNATAARLAAGARYLEAFVEAEGLAGAATVTVSDSDMVLSLSDTIGFASGSAELLPGALPILREVRTLARSMPDFGIDIAGHTDDVPINTARFPSNLELSLARAAQVARQLTAGDSQLKVRTVAAGFGEHRPMASNADPRGRAQNRRVELRLVPIDHSTP